MLHFSSYMKHFHIFIIIKKISHLEVIHYHIFVLLNPLHFYRILLAINIASSGFSKQGIFASYFSYVRNTYFIELNLQEMILCAAMTLGVFHLNTSLEILIFISKKHIFKSKFHLVRVSSKKEF